MIFINQNGIDIEVSGQDKDAVLQAQSEISQEYENNEKLKKQANADKVVARQAVLDRLGITADEAALLLG